MAEPLAISILRKQRDRITCDAVDALSWAQRHNHPDGTMLVPIGTEAGPWGKRDLAELVRRHSKAEVVLRFVRFRLNRVFRLAPLGLDPRVHGWPGRDVSGLAASASMALCNGAPPLWISATTPWPAVTVIPSPACRLA